MNAAPTVPLLIVKLLCGQACSSDEDAVIGPVMVVIEQLEVVGYIHKIYSACASAAHNMVVVYHNACNVVEDGEQSAAQRIAHQPPPRRAARDGVKKPRSRAPKAVGLHVRVRRRRYAAALGHVPFPVHFHLMPK